MSILFNKPFLTGKESLYIGNVLQSKKFSGDGYFSKKCQSFFEDRYKLNKVLLTSSCTDALEMAAILADIQTGDEVIMPSYTFVSTANAFILRGAKIVFVDSRDDHPGMNEILVEGLVTERTKAIVVVHYAGIAVDMDLIQSIALKYSLFVIEDAAQAIDSYYKGKPLGSFGDFSAFSFHETKNIHCGEGGLIVINKHNYANRAEIIREKGTNRSSFFRGEVDKYSWVDVGSSFLPSEILAAFLFAQLESIDEIQQKRITIWNYYYSLLTQIANNSTFRIPTIPVYASNNAHMFFIVCKDIVSRDALISFLKSKGINTVFHYLSLHKSNFYFNKHDGRELPNSDYYSDSLLRLPLHCDLQSKDVEIICDSIKEFYELPFNDC